jgi:hypothetical protein
MAFSRSEREPRENRRVLSRCGDCPLEIPGILRKFEIKLAELTECQTLSVIIKDQAEATQAC